MCRPDVALSLPCWLSQLNWDSQQGRDFATSGCNKKKLMGPILFLYYEESLVSSNLNSKLLWFHSVRPNVSTYLFMQNKNYSPISFVKKLGEFLIHTRKHIFLIKFARKMTQEMHNAHITVSCWWFLDAVISIPFS